MAIELKDYLKDRFEKAKQEIAFRMETKAIQKVPVRTGNLKASIWVGAGFKEEVNYAKHVEYGTNPHVILPKGKINGGADALYWKGAKHPVKKVNHPGTRPKPFLRPAMFETQQEIPSILAKWLSNA